MRTLASCRTAAHGSNYCRFSGVLGVLLCLHRPGATQLLQLDCCVRHADACLMLARRRAYSPATHGASSRFSGVLPWLS